ncbi:nucleic acid-binding protein [Natronomonas sp. EA1]|uniref:nucleic acid-binding protein n=1 Tax=Natronomonas sp. EA1 TaxID=3421655 RepID=UPI003EBC3BD6
MIIAVSDTGPLIHLAEIDSFSLLRSIDELLIPETVRDELATGGLPDGFGDLDVSVVPDIDIDDVDLDPGETAALGVARDRNAIFLTDDLDARQAAKSRGVEVHGTVGLIALAHSRGELSEEAATDRMRSLASETSLFVTDAVIQRGIALLNQS